MHVHDWHEYTIMVPEPVLCRQCILCDRCQQFWPGSDLWNNLPDGLPRHEGEIDIVAELRARNAEMAVDLAALQEDLKDLAPLIASAVRWRMRAEKSRRQVRGLRQGIRVAGAIHRCDEVKRAKGWEREHRLHERLAELLLVREKHRGECHAEAVGVFANAQIDGPIMASAFACALGNLRKGRNA